MRAMRPERVKAHPPRAGVLAGRVASPVRGPFGVWLSVVRPGGVPWSNFRIDEGGQ